MSQFIAVAAEENQTHYINIAQIRHIHDVPAEESVRIEFDDQHRLYLTRDRAAELLALVAKG
jgi:hypothetical protein